MTLHKPFPRIRGGEVLLVFTRYPQAGKTKTRLIPALGPVRAAELQREMTEHTLARMRPLAIQRGVRLTVQFEGGSRTGTRRWLGGGLEFASQGPGDLGERLQRATAEQFSQGARSVVVIGTDCPELDGRLVVEAFELLREKTAVFGPARDGGYYLIGLRTPMPQLFQGIAWGTGSVLAQSLAAAQLAGIEPALLCELSDVDEPGDLPLWESARAASRTISVIIPVLNEAEELRVTLDAVARGEPREIIVVDGGSSDGTQKIALEFGAQVIASAPSRARQMNAGAAMASSELLLFLHADTHPPDGYAGLLGSVLKTPGVAGGAFGFGIREHFRGRRLVEWMVKARCHVLHNPFGDQGFYLRRDWFNGIGGFKDWPLLEDVEILKRLRPHGSIVVTRERVSTSGRRWLKRGVCRTFVTNLLVMAGYYAGVPKEHLARFYRSKPARSPGN